MIEDLNQELENLVQLNPSQELLIRTVWRRATATEAYRQARQRFEHEGITREGERLFMCLQYAKCPDCGGISGGSLDDLRSQTKTPCIFCGKGPMVVEY